MKVLMFGWEFPPFNTGGLGTACYGLTKGLAHNGVNVTFVLPHIPEKAKSDFVKLISAGNISKIKLRGVKTNLVGYMTSEEYRRSLLLNKAASKRRDIYGRDLFAEVYRYSLQAGLIARYEPHDLIHCHDWMTYQAGIKARKISGKPLVIHVHATEFDRTGGHGVNQAVYNIEREGMHAADSIIAVSNFTKNRIVEHYGIDPMKVQVVHNAIEFNGDQYGDFGLKKGNKVVLFMGRVTLQKGPDYFLYTAKRVLEIDPNVRFIIAGSGDMTASMIEKAADLGIADKVLFAGFLRGPDIDRAYQMADLYVMPSVSEPFGLTPLEAMRNKTPVIISKQSGVSEVINNCLKSDFWDIDRMTNQIIGVLRYKEAHEALKEGGYQEVQKFNWDEPARKCVEVYNRVLRGI